MEVNPNKHIAHSAHADAHGHAHGHHDHDHDHDENFWSKYIFSTDHKMIAKQYLNTAIVMAFIAMFMSLIFRMQLAWPDAKIPFLTRPYW
jgi:cytochrome c oxidase subunit I